MNKQSKPSRPNLEHYKKLAKDVVKAWKSGSATQIMWEGQQVVVNRAHLAKLHPRFSKLSEADLAEQKFVLTDAQHIIATHLGFDSWPKFAVYVKSLQGMSTFEQFMIAASCPTRSTHLSATLDEAQSLLDQHPEFESKDIYSAAVTGNPSAIRVFLERNPKLANRKGGPLKWDALTYLCFSRFLRFDKSRTPGFVSAAKALLEFGADIQTGWYDETQQPTPEWESIMYGVAGLAQNAPMTQLLLDHGLDPNDNETPYHVPESYDTSALEVLAGSGKMTPASLAMMLLRKADWHDLAGIELMLKHGADPNYMLPYDSNALQHAIRRDNNLESIVMMLDHGADPTLKSPKMGISAIDLSAQRGRDDVLQEFRRRQFTIEGSEIVKALIQCAGGIVPKHLSRETMEHFIHSGGSYLAQFAGNGNTSGVHALLDLGIPISSNYWGDGYFGIPPSSTALHVACWKIQPTSVEALIQRGASINAKDSTGRTPLQWAIKACVDSYWMRRRTPQCVKFLLEAGASLEGIEMPCGYDLVDELLLLHSNQTNT